MGTIRVSLTDLDHDLSRALSAYLTAQPSLTVVDSVVGDVIVSGLDVQPTLANVLPAETSVLVLGPDRPDLMLDVIEAGAMGYLPSDSKLEVIADAIRAVASGEAVIPPRMLGTLLRRVVQRRRAQKVDQERLDTLTPREREVFDLLAAGLDRSAISEHLFISVGTVRSHLQHLFRKLDIHTQAEAVALAARCGLDPHRPEDRS